MQAPDYIKNLKLNCETTFMKPINQYSVKYGSLIYFKKLVSLLKFYNHILS